MTRQIIHGGQLLRAVRTKFSLTQEEICEITEIPLRTYQGWELKRTEPDFSTVCFICVEAFKLNLFDAWKLAELVDESKRTQARTS
jgi:transcriptional regulator with XRE-family HTH domain